MQLGNVLLLFIYSLAVQNKNGQNISANQHQNNVQKSINTILAYYKIIMFIIIKMIHVTIHTLTHTYIYIVLYTVESA